MCFGYFSRFFHYQQPLIIQISNDYIRGLIPLLSIFSQPKIYLTERQQKLLLFQVLQRDHVMVHCHLWVWKLSEFLIAHHGEDVFKGNLDCSGFWGQAFIALYIYLNLLEWRYWIILGKYSLITQKKTYWNLKSANSNIEYSNIYIAI